MARESQRDVIQLSSFLPYQITVLADRIARRIAKAADAHGGLNLSQWRVLAAIAESPGRTAQEVVTVTPMDKAIVSRAVSALLEQGLLVRRASQLDGRLGHLFLTPLGEKRYGAIASDVRRIERDLFRALKRGDKQRVLALFLTLNQSLASDNPNL